MLATNLIPPRNYSLATSKSVLDIEYKTEIQYLLALNTLYDEQKEILETELPETVIIVRFLEDKHFGNENYLVLNNPTEILTELDRLAIKDGYDLVKYENGNLGFLTYYNGYENGLEIQTIDTDWHNYLGVSEDLDIELENHFT